MSWYAIDDIEDALSATRQFLLPFDLRKWLKLALIVFFIGGASSGFNFSFPSDDFSGGETPPDLGPEEVGLIIAIAAVVILLVLFFAILSAVFQFVFVDAVRGEAVRIRAPFRRWFGKGVRLFVFTLVLLLLILAPILGVVGVFVIALTPLLLIFLLPFLFIVAVLLAITLSLTTDFVVPVMMREDLGVLAGWRRFWPSLRADWKQYGLFIVLRWLLGIVGGILVAIALALVLIPVGGIVAAVGFALFAGTGGFTTATIAVLVILGIPLALLVLLYALLVQVPVATFFRFYSLFVLGDAVAEFDLIPDQRRAVRAAAESADATDESMADDTDESRDDEL